MTLKEFQCVFKDCADVKYERVTLKEYPGKICNVVYTEVTLSSLFQLGVQEGVRLREKKDIINGFLAGDILVFIEGEDYVLKVADKGYPNLGVQSSEDEKVLRGTNESFSDSVKTNTALIRKRLRTPGVKVLESKAGVRSNTTVYILYLEDVVAEGVVDKMQQQLNAYEIDGVLDSGVLEQLVKRKWYSPFPQVQTTKRPDRACFGLLEGRVVLLSDNSPVALLFPANLNSFLVTTDDYYNPWMMATMARVIRYMAAFLAVTMPGLYLAVSNFHTQILPTPLILAFANARSQVPFPAAMEIILMELSFELLREAGVRLPGVMGNTIGIVGGLIIGQAAVDANLVSPIVVIVVAFTALCAFAIPNEELAFACRLLKFYVILMSAWLGYFGFLLAVFTILIHLSKLKSYGIPYLMPFVGAELNGYQDLKDSIIRMPTQFLKLRPYYARAGQKRKLRKEE